MKRIALWLPLVLLIVSTNPCFGSDDARRFIAGLEALKAGDNEAAISQFNAIVQTGLENPKLFYNLGNAYLKNGALGSAILWYERAAKLDPYDPDVIFNLAYARSLAKDVQEIGPPPLAQILFFWKYRFSARTIALLALIANGLFWVLFMVWLHTRRAWLKPAAWIILIPAVIFILTAAWNYYENAHRKQAIVLPAQIAVRSGLQETSTRLFELHAGAKVTIIKQRKDYYQIKFSPEKIGWITHDVVGLI